VKDGNLRGKCVLPDTHFKSDTCDGEEWVWVEHKMYCSKCGGFDMGIKEHDGNYYCRKCHDDLFTTEPVSYPIGESQRVQVCDDVRIPLALQKRLLVGSFYDTVLWLQEILEDDDFVRDLEEMALARLEQNYPKYGSTMYSWDHSKNFRAIMEELADVFVYKSAEQA